MSTPQVKANVKQVKIKSVKQDKAMEKLSIHQAETDHLGQTSSKKLSGQEEVDLQSDTITVNVLPAESDDNSSHYQSGLLNDSQHSDPLEKTLSNQQEEQSPPPTSQLDGCQGRSLPQPHGEGRMSQGGYNDDECGRKQTNKQADIRLYLQKRDKHCMDPVLTTGKWDSRKVEGMPTESKMNMIRRKMSESRKKADRMKAGDLAVVRKQHHPKTYKGQRLLSAKDVVVGEAQDDLEVVVIGSDVSALYPSLDDLEVGIICYDAVMASNIRFQNINYMIAAKYIAINLSEAEPRLSPLYPVLPRRTSRQGVRPGVTSDPEKSTNWSYPKETFTAEQERMIVAKMVQIAVITMMNTHLYEFDGRIFLQQAGGPIGLRATCAVARVVMNHWDSLWLKLIKEQNLTTEENDRYMDDVRVFALALKPGWRWDGDGFYFCGWKGFREKYEGKGGRTARERELGEIIGI